MMVYPFFPPENRLQTQEHVRQDNNSHKHYKKGISHTARDSLSVMEDVSIIHGKKNQSISRGSS